MFGRDDGECLCRLEQVLQEFAEYNVRFRADRCIFVATHVPYLGSVLDAHGIHWDDEKLRLLRPALPTQDIPTLR
jgi:hypothetical protein